MIQKVIEHIDKYSMFQKGDKVIVAVSGGPDSMCLIHILNSIKDLYGITLYAAHVNHCLRGDDSDGDEEYVRRFCEKSSIQFFSKRVDINAICKQLNISSETAGREARYEFFEGLMKTIDAHKVALAHNLNDQAETMLMRIMRGTGLEGLNGIRPVRDAVFVRPILILDREQIEDYCNRHDLHPRIDKSNYENIYNRNKIRLELIPYIRENFNKDIVNTLSRLSYIIGRDNDYMEEAANEKYNVCCSEENGKAIIYNKIIYEKEAVASRIVRRAIKYVQGSLKNIEMIHVSDIISLFTIGTGKKINLPGKIVCENIYGDVHIYIKKDANSSLIKDDTIILKKNHEKFILPMEIYVGEMQLKVFVRMVEKGENIKFGEHGLKKYFDYDKIKGDISIRYRRDGDRIIPYGMSGSKKLKDLFIDLKVPKDEREKIPLMCFDGEISWIIGYRVSNNYIVTKNTKNIIEIKIEKGEN